MLDREMDGGILMILEDKFQYIICAGSSPWVIGSSNCLSPEIEVICDVILLSEVKKVACDMSIHELYDSVPSAPFGMLLL